MNNLKIFLLVFMFAEPLIAKSLTYKDMMLVDRPIAVSQDVLSAEKVRDDIDLLNYAFEKGYGGFKYLPSSEIAATQKALREAATTSKTAMRFCDEIGDALWVLQDNHIRAKLGDITCGPKRKAAKRVGAVGDNFGKAESEKTKKPFVFVSEKVHGKTLAKLSIVSFPFNEDSVWNGFEAALIAIKKFDALIVDLRGNGGGDDSRGYELAETLTGLKVTPDWDATVVRQTAETLTLLRNMFVFSKISSRAQGQVPEPYHDVRIKEIDAKIALAVAGKLPDENRTKFTPARKLDLAGGSFRGPVIILVDAGCASSCESSMNALKLHPNAKVIGENTAGYFHFGDVGKLLLPNSNVMISMPTKYDSYANGKMYDKVGFAPDIKVPEGKNAMDYALTALSFKKSK